MVPSSSNPGSDQISAERFRDLLGLPTDPETVLRELLSRDEFRESAVQSLLDRLWAFLETAGKKALSWIVSHWPSMGSFEGDYEYLWTFLGILFVDLVLSFVIACIILLVVRVVWPALRPKWSSRAPSPEEAFLDPCEPDASREQALSLAQQGRLREALMLLFRYVLKSLDKQGRLNLHPCKTNREILRAVQPGESLRETLAEMIAVFNAVRYGGASCDRSAFDRFLRLSDRAMGGL